MPIPKISRQAGQYIDLGTFLDEKVIPAVFEALDTVFPEFGWSRGSRGWTATQWPSDFPFTVNDKTPGRLMVYSKTPHFLAIHGHSGMTLLQYANNGRPAKGAEFTEAVEKLALRVGIKPPTRAFTQEELQKARAREIRRNALEAVFEIAHAYLMSEKGDKARAYVETRGLNQEQQKELQIGLMPPVEELVKSLRAMGGNLLVEEAREVGATWPPLAGYVSIPWRDEAGGALTIYGRWPGELPLMKNIPAFSERREKLMASKPDEEPKIPKTIALPGEGTKASPLYFDRARTAGHKDHIVAVEGVLDAAVLQTHGDSRVVAYVAAQFNAEQVQTLVKYRVRSVVIVPDPDGGGAKGAISSVSALEKAGIQSFVASLPEEPEDMDPDKYVLKYGIEAWRDLVDNTSISGAKYRAAVILNEVTPEDPDIKRRAALEHCFELAGSLHGPHAAVDRQEVLELAGEKTGYVADALAEIFEQRLHEQERKRAAEGLDKAVKDALKAIKDGESPFVIMDELRQATSLLRHNKKDLPPPFSVERLERETEALTTGLSTGWASLDEMDVYLHGGELAVLAARTGHGKTTALVNLLNNLVNEESDGITLLFSMEEPEVRIFHRLLALQAGQEWTTNKVRNYLMKRQDQSITNERGLKTALATLKANESRLMVIYRPTWTAGHISQYVKELAREKPIKAVLVDYLQRVPPGPGNEGRRRDEEVSAIARTLREMAVEVACPVVCGAQINREAAKRGQDALDGSWGDPKVKAALKKKRPQLHELREGGSEQEAELVLGLHNWRADFQDEAGENSIPETTPLEIGVLKNRYGTVGKWATMDFTGASGLIREPKSNGF